MPRYMYVNPKTQEKWISPKKLSDEQLDEAFGVDVPPISAVTKTPASTGLAALSGQTEGPAEGILSPGQRSALATGLRIGAPIAAGAALSMTGIGAAIGGPLTALGIGAASAATEVGVETGLEGRAISAPEVLESAIVSTFTPGGGLVGVGKSAVRAGLKGAGFGWGSATLHALARGEGYPSAGTQALGAFLGAGLNTGGYLLTSRSAVNELMPADIADDVHKATSGQQAALRKKVIASGSGSLREELDDLVNATTHKPAPLPTFTPIEMGPVRGVKGRFIKKSDYPYTPEDLGEFVGRGGTPPSIPEAPVQRALNPRGGHITSRAIIPTKYWFDKVRTETGLPVYEDVYYATQQAKIARDQYMDKVGGLLAEVHSRKGAGDIDDYIPLLKGIAGKDFDVDRLVKDYLPRIRAAAGDSDDIEAAIGKAFPIEPPPEVATLKREISSGFIGHTELNPAIFTSKMIRVFANKTHLDEVTKGIETKYLRAGLPNHITEPIKDYVARLSGETDMIGRDINKAIDGMINALPARLRGYYGRAGLPDNLDRFISLQYLGTLGGRPGPLVRNALQTFQTGMMFLGRWHATGLRRAIGGIEEARNLGFVAPAESIVYEAERAFGQGSRLRGASKLLLKPYKTVDDYNRAIMAFGQYERTLDAARRAKGDIHKFVDYAALDAGFTQAEAVRIAKLYAGGETKEAARQAGIALADNTQYLYSLENKPPALTRTTVGKAVGSFGNWSLWYGNLLKEVALNPNIPNGRKTAILSRWILANSAMLAGIYGVAHTLGIPSTALDIIKGAGGFLGLGPVAFNPLETPVPRLAGAAINAVEAVQGRRSPKAVGKSLLRAGGAFVPAYGAFEDAEKIGKIIKTSQDRKLLLNVLGLQQGLPPPR